MMTAELWIVLIVALVLVALTARQMRANNNSAKRIQTDLYSEIQERIDLLQDRMKNEPEYDAHLDSLMIGELRRALSRSKRGQL